MPYTRGFIDDIELEVHFSEHGEAVGATNSDEYLLFADTFLGGPLHPSMIECTRIGKSDMLRYDEETEEFGVLSHDGYIRTYFIPDPSIHGHPTNYDYFRYECQKRR